MISYRVPTLIGPSKAGFLIPGAREITRCHVALSSADVFAINTADYSAQVVLGSTF